MLDKLLGRLSRYNYGKNSKKELRLKEKRNFEKESHDEMSEPPTEVRWYEEM